jgi:hypothetical protein
MWASGRQSEREPPAIVALRLHQDMIERSDAADSRLATLANEPIEKIDRNEPMLPIESSEPVDPMDRIDPRDRMLRIESVDLIDHKERVGADMVQSWRPEISDAVISRCPRLVCPSASRD